MGEEEADRERKFTQSTQSRTEFIQGRLLAGTRFPTNGCQQNPPSRAHAACYATSVRIAKPLLLITTPIGVAWGLYEAWRLAGGLVFLMAALVMVIAVAMSSVVLTIRRERRAEEAKQRAQQTAPPPTP